MSPGLTVDTKWFTRQRQLGSPFNPLSWISTPSQLEEVPALCLGTDCSTLDQRVQERNLVRRVIGISPLDIVIKY